MTPSSTSPRPCHLWLALSPHGYGHAAMTAPLVAELRRRRPHLRLTIQTALPRDFLDTRYSAFDLVTDIPDFGFRMVSPLEIDVAASAATYLAHHADFAGLVAAEAARLRQAAPDLVLANVPYVTVAAAAEARIPVAAFSSLNWADMADHVFAGRAELDRVRTDIRGAYGRADVFLRACPAQPMTLPNIRDIGPVARLGRRRGEEIRSRLGLDEHTRLGVIAYGGIDHRLPLDQWPRLDGWFWLSSLADTPARPDMAPWRAAGVPFADLLPSVDLLVTKPGYGTFSEAGLAGVAVLYEPRTDWPEAPPMQDWLARHTRCLPAAASEMLGGLDALLQRLFSLPTQPLAQPSGVEEGADVLEALLDRRPMPAGAVGLRRNHDAEVSNGGER